MIRRAVSRVVSLVQRAGRPAVLVVAAEPDAALLASAAALRRLGARITRYDTEAGTLEATSAGDTVRLAITAQGAEQSRVEIASAGAARAWARRLRTELGRPVPETAR